MKTGETLIVGVAWFDRAQWTRLKEIAPDKSALDDSFEQWERNARSVVAKMKAEGLRVKEVSVDVDQLLAWCMLHGMAPDSNGRANYAAYVVKRESGEV